MMSKDNQSVSTTNHDRWTPNWRLFIGLALIAIAFMVSNRLDLRGSVVERMRSPIIPSDHIEKNYRAIIANPPQEKPAPAAQVG